MALPGSGIVNRGLQVTGGRTWNTADAFAEVDGILIDNSATNYEAAHTAANGAGGTARTITSSHAQAFDAAPARTNQTISATITVAPANAVFTWKSISVHTSTTPTTSSTTLFAGLLTGDIAKSASVQIAITLSCLYTDNS